MEHMPRMTNDGRPIIVPFLPNSEPADRGEPPFGTTWEYLDSQDEQDAFAEPTEDERAAEYAAFTDGDITDEDRPEPHHVEYEDYREGLCDRYLRPSFVNWNSDRY